MSHSWAKASSHSFAPLLCKGDPDCTELDGIIPRIPSAVCRDVTVPCQGTVCLWVPFVLNKKSNIEGLFMQESMYNELRI